MEIKLDTLIDALSEISDDGHVREGWAGGSVALWTVNKQGHVVCLTDNEGPFTPHLNHFGDKAVDVPGFMVGVYGDEDEYLAGGVPLDGLDSLMEFEADPLLLLLGAALGKAGAR